MLFSLSYCGETRICLHPMTTKLVDNLLIYAHNMMVSMATMLTDEKYKLNDNV